jgi:hypothetical protein
VFGDQCRDGTPHEFAPRASDDVADEKEIGHVRSTGM